MKYRKCEICGMKTERKDGQKRFFMARFPLDGDRCKQWVKVTGKEDLAYIPIEKLHENKFVCGKHFKDRDFKKKRTQLKKHAIPSMRLTGPPLSDEILAEFPYHIHTGDPSSSSLVKSVSEDKIPVAEHKISVVETATESLHENKVPVAEKIPVLENKVSAMENIEIFYENEILVVENTVEIISSETMIESSSSVTIQKQKQDIQHIGKSAQKEKSMCASKSKHVRKSEKGATTTATSLQVTPRKKKLIKRLNKYRYMLKQFRQKVKLLDKIKSPALKAFLQGALKNQGRHPQGRRWSNDMKGLVLAIYKKSAKVYRYLKQLMPLPSERTLQALLQNIPMEPGWNEIVFNYLKKKQK